MALLEIDEIHVFYDKIEALKGISVSVEDKQIVTLVGGNGAGKSTTLRAISGTCIRARAISGSTDRRSLAGMGAHDISAIGLRHVPEGRRVFGKLTVAENLDMGAFTRNDRAEIAQDREQMMVAVSRGCSVVEAVWPARCRVASSRCWRRRAHWMSAARVADG